MKYNFIYSSSNTYIPFCITSIDSLLTSNPEFKGKSTFHIISNDIDGINLAILEKLLKQNNVELKIINTDDVKLRLKKANIHLQFNISSAIRLFMPQLVDVDKALFIDSDTYIRSGIKELYDTNIEQAPCAMVYDQPILYKHQIECDLDRNSPYFNAGIILINLKYWRDNKILEKLLDYFQSKTKFSTDEQGAINGILSRDSVSLSYKYNVMKTIQNTRYITFCKMSPSIAICSKKEYLEAKYNPVIIHFHGPTLRPWEKWCSRPFTKQYREALLKNFPDFKLWSPQKSKWFLIKQYLWNKYLCHLR